MSPPPKKQDSSKNLLAPQNKQPPQNRRPTIYDIAQRCGISGATVSRVLSGSGYPVKASVRETILVAANEMGYAPNVLGRMLRRQTSTDIGVVLPNMSNPFFTSVLLGLETEAHRLGYHVLISNSFRNPDAERHALLSLRSRQVAGLVLSLVRPDLKLLQEIKAAGIGLVTCDQPIPDLACNHVAFNFHAAGHLAATHLAGLGHRHILFASSPIDRPGRRALQEGFLEGLSDFGIKEGPSRCLIAETEIEKPQGYELENGRALSEQMLALPTRPTAIFAGNDLTAIGLMQGLNARGIRIPEDISVLGFDDLPFSGWVTPALTTIVHPAYETGVASMRLLKQSIDHPEALHVEDFQPRLVIRASVAPPGGSSPT